MDEFYFLFPPTSLNCLNILSYNMRCVTFIIMRGQTVSPKTTTVAGHTQEHVPFGLNRGDRRESAPYVTSGTP